MNSSRVPMWWFEQGADWQQLPSLQTQVLQRSQECMKLFVFFFANLLTRSWQRGRVLLRRTFAVPAGVHRLRSHRFLSEHANIILHPERGAPPRFTISVLKSR